MKELKLCLVLLSAILLSACGGDNSPSSEPSKPTPIPTPTTSKIVIPTTENTKPVFNTEGGTSTVKFTASEAWTASAANTRADDWLSVSPTSGSAGEVTLTITTTANDTYDERSGSITIKCGTSSQTIVVTQKQKDSLTITSDKVEVTSEGGTFGVEVKANIDFSVKVDVDWISQVNTRALATTNLSFAVKENSDISKREGHITISSGAFSEIVTVYQAGDVPTIVISQNDYTVGADGSDVTVEVSSNVDVEVNIPNVDWISQANTRSLSTHTYVFNISKNDSYDNRKAEILFSNKDNGLSEKVTINQLQNNAIVVADSSYVLNSNDTKLEFDVQTNIEISVSVDADWITQANTRALHNEKLSFNITANESEESRNAIITIIGSDITQKVNVTQKSKYQENIVFADPLMKKYCVSCYDTDGDGELSYGEAAAVTIAPTLGRIVGGPDYWQDITSFDEFQYFNNVTGVGTYAFHNCKRLKSIIFPVSLTTISGLSFTSCVSLTDLNFGNVTTIDDDAFLNCTSLRNITFSDKIKSISSRAFKDCTSLTIITCLAINPPVLGTSVFFGDDSFTIYVPAVSVDAYKAADGWKEYADRIKPIAE